MPANPESMRPTMLSRHEKVVEEARGAKDAVLYESAQSFLNGVEKKKKK